MDCVIFVIIISVKEVHQNDKSLKILIKIPASFTYSKHFFSSSIVLPGQLVMSRPPLRGGFESSPKWHVDTFISWNCFMFFRISLCRGGITFSLLVMRAKLFFYDYLHVINLSPSDFFALLFNREKKSSCFFIHKLQTDIVQYNVQAVQIF